MNKVDGNTKINLCDTCKRVFPECPAVGDDVTFGDGIGNDNICKCKYYKAGMPEYIERQAAIDVVDDYSDSEYIGIWYPKAREALVNLPATDVVVPVRCKDCKRRMFDGYCTMFQKNVYGIASAWFMPEDDDFCSRGERREE